MNQTFSFDKAVFVELGAELGEADAIEVLQAFLEDTARKMAMLAASSENRPLIRREAHSIKSSAATFGFSDLSRLAKELEFSAETIPLAQLQESIARLQQTFQATKEFAQANLLGAG
jgi:HPt (histidine-containing phosphotransfer) domain-containing protein